MFGIYYGVTGQNQVLVANCHLPQIQFDVILLEN